MKFLTAKILGLLLLVVLAASVAVVARDGKHRPRHDRPAHREVNVYFEANVLPVLRQQRQQLEPRLAADDRARLATYRRQLWELKVRGQALRRSMQPAGAPDVIGTVPTEAQHQQAQQLRSEVRALLLNVTQMAQKYDAAITQLTQELQPQKDKWAADLQAIVARHATPAPQAQPIARRAQLHGQGRLQQLFKPARFLLMEPTAPATGPAERGLGGSGVYPNPASATSRLEYAVKTAGPVTINLFDGQGTKLRTLLTETQVERGTHTQPLDLQGLPAGTYFYRITTKTGSETKRFVRE